MKVVSVIPTLMYSKTAQVSTLWERKHWPEALKERANSLGPQKRIRC